MARWKRMRVAGARPAAAKGRPCRPSAARRSLSSPRSQRERGPLLEAAGFLITSVEERSVWGLPVDVVLASRPMQ